MSEHPIPDAALDDRLAFVGTSGSGKTYAAGTVVERLLASDARVVIVDPLDVWWGLRLQANGEPSHWTIPILGGAHGDLALNEDAGAAIGHAVAASSESCIVSLGGLPSKAAERRFMRAFLQAIDESATGAPFHLIFDEADLWAPQRASGETAILLGRMEEIIRRGRVKGFIPWLITQRPAVIAKDVLSQMDGMIAMKLTGPHDRKAIADWIGPGVDAAKVIEPLATFVKGQGVLWIPARDVLTAVQFPAKETYDSSRTPTRGETLLSVAVAPINIEGLRVAIAPKPPEPASALPAKVRSEKEKQAIAPSADAIAEMIASAEQRGYVRGVRASADHIRGNVLYWSPPARDKQTMLETADKHPVGSFFADEILQLLHRSVSSFAPSNEGEESYESRNPPYQAVEKIDTTPARAPAKPRQNITENITDKNLGPERRILAVLASCHPATMTEAQWSVAAGMKRTGGTWGAYKSRLRSASMIVQTGNAWAATKAGVQAVGKNVEPMPGPGPDLAEYWIARIASIGPMLRHLVKIYPRKIGRGDLAHVLGMSASGGSFGAYLSRLRSVGIITVDGGQIAASRELMEGK